MGGILVREKVDKCKKNNNDFSKNVLILEKCNFISQSQEFSYIISSVV